MILKNDELEQTQNYAVCYFDKQFGDKLNTPLQVLNYHSGFQFLMNEIQNIAGMLRIMGMEDIIVAISLKPVNPFSIDRNESIAFMPMSPDNDIKVEIVFKKDDNEYQNVFQDVIFREETKKQITTKAESKLENIIKSIAPNDQKND